MRAVAFGSGDIRPVREGLAGEQADPRVVPAFREVVAGFESVLSSAEFAGRARGEVIGERQKDFRSKGLQQGSPRFPRECRFERADDFSFRLSAFFLCRCMPRNVKTSQPGSLIRW
jgi:hypothetical protein